MNPVSIRYEIDTETQLTDNIKQAKEDFDRLVKEGYASVRIVISRHPYSEGIWVEAGDKEVRLSESDYLYKSNKEQCASSNG